MFNGQVASPILIEEITLKNILSFGENTPSLKLRPLNLLIGPNGSGKSNLIEALTLLRSTASEEGIKNVIRQSGGIVKDWIWRGNPQGVAQIEAIIAQPYFSSQPLRHGMMFAEVGQRFEIQDEWIENQHPNNNNTEPYFYYRYDAGNPVINVNDVRRSLRRETILPNLSILSQRNDPDQYPEITYLAGIYRKIRTYRDWSLGRNTNVRQQLSADERNDILQEDFSNLGLFLSSLRSTPRVKKSLREKLQDLYTDFTDMEIVTANGMVQIFFEEGDYTIPATRLSDGTLRYLCLLAILLDPTPPPLICIEEPEIGMHPDILPGLAKLLIETSTRTQLIVTTHSNILVDAMTHCPENVLVCEKHDGQTHIERLRHDDLKIWLDKYRLGELWTRGELGGNRW